MKPCSVTLLLLCCCALPDAQRLAEQSAAKALSQLAPAWGEGGPPSRGLSSTVDALKAQLQSASASLLLLWKVKPHDAAVHPETQTILTSVMPYRVQLDKAPQDELVFLVQTYSGELFLVLFTQDEEGGWAFVDTYRLPSLARKESCRAAGGGVIRLRNIQATSNAPAFLWVEVLAAEQCAAPARAVRTLHLLALEGGRLRPALEAVTAKTQQQGETFFGEQILSQVTLEPRQNTLLISGVRRMYSETGGEVLQMVKLSQWYYFDGSRYQMQK